MTLLPQTLQELQMFSSVTLNCQVTMIFRIEGSPLSEMYSCSKMLQAVVLKLFFFCQFNVKLLNLSRQWPAEKANNGQLLELQVGHFISQFHVLFLSVALGGLATQPTTYMLLGEPLFMELFFIASSTWSSLHHRSFV